MRSIALAMTFEPIHIKGAAAAAAESAIVSSPMAGPAAKSVAQLTPRKDANMVPIAVPNAVMAGAAKFMAYAKGIIAAPNPASSSSAMPMSTTLAASMAEVAATAVANVSIPRPAATITTPALAKLLQDTSLNSFMALAKRYRSPANPAIATAPNSTLGLPKASTPCAISLRRDPAYFGTPPNALPAPPSMLPIPLVAAPGSSPRALPAPVSAPNPDEARRLPTRMRPPMPLLEYMTAKTVGTAAVTISAIVPVAPPPLITPVILLTKPAKVSNA